MKIFKRITAIVSILIGVVFLVIGGTDIQLGFGILMITNGILHI